MDNQQLSIDTARWFPSAAIPALAPYGLEVVPGYELMPGVTIPTGWRPTPGEPSFENPVWRVKHKAWTRKLWEVRPQIWATANADPHAAALERFLCAQDPNYFGAVYGWILDTKPKVDEPMNKPYAKFAYQCHNTNAMLRHIRTPGRSALWRDKSRQLGISWDDEHFDTWFYLFDEGAAKLVSRNEKWVYNGRSTEAMFGKILYILIKIGEHAPYLLPGNFSVKQLWKTPHFRDLALINPLTGTMLAGESTTAQVGRGGTYTYGRVDEGAFVPDLDDTITSLQQAVDSLFLASTASLDAGDAWLDGWQAAKREELRLAA